MNLSTLFSVCDLSYPSDNSNVFRRYGVPCLEDVREALRERVSKHIIQRHQGIMKENFIPMDDLMALDHALDLNEEGMINLVVTGPQLLILMLLADLLMEQCETLVLNCLEHRSGTDLYIHLMEFRVALDTPVSLMPVWPLCVQIKQGSKG